jgi:serine/threonine-protein phosphatase 2B regulatory subunit
MVSGFEPSEIIQYYLFFDKHKSSTEKLTKDVFMELQCVAINPLKDRIADCFGYDVSEALDFYTFLIGVSLFNSIGSREQKFRTAFKLHDFDDDGVISREDLCKYVQRITADTLTEKELLEMVDQVFLECSSDPKFEIISYADFKIMISPTDFHTKLQLPILV